MMTSLLEEFRQLDVGGPLQFRNLSLFPLLRRTSESEPDYCLLEDAIQQGLATVTELSEGASVPELRFVNRAGQPVLLLDGEELIGAKQNRVLNLTILAPAKQELVIPVSCVEAGRWRMESQEFTSAAHLMYARARAARAVDVTASMRMAGTRKSDQTALWDEIEKKAGRVDAPSPTRAMAAMYERHAITVDAYVRAFEWQPGQVGAGFAIGGRMVGIDLVDHPATMRRIFAKLVRSYAMDAIDEPATDSKAAASEELRDFLNQVAGAPSFAQPALGLGKDLRIAGTAVCGAALFVETRFVHVCAFAASGHTSGARLETRMARPSRRRM